MKGFEKRFAVDRIHDDREVFWGLEVLVNADHVRVVYHSQDFDLSDGLVGAVGLAVLEFKFWVDSLVLI